MKKDMERTLIIYYEKDKKTVTMTEKVGEIQKEENRIEYIENELMEFEMNVERFTSQFVLQKLIPNFDYFEFIKIVGDDIQIIKENKFADIQRLYINLLRK